MSTQVFGSSVTDAGSTSAANANCPVGPVSSIFSIRFPLTAPPIAPESVAFRIFSSAPTGRTVSA